MRTKGKGMNKSEHIEMLASALSKFQGEIQNVFKGKKGYGYNYADLAPILEYVRPLLSKYGLSMLQLPSNNGEYVSIETIIMHESGQYISSILLMPVDSFKGMTRAQSIGCIISYARRYSLTSVLGIAQTDTDDRELLEEEVRPVKVQKSAYLPKSQLNANVNSEQNLEKVIALIKELDISQNQIDNWCKKAGASGLETMSAEKLGMLASMLEGRKAISMVKGVEHVE
jgi:hypothetical protein